MLRALGSRWAGGGCGQLQAALGSALGLRAAGDLYVTPSGQQGLAAHYNDHCKWSRLPPPTCPTPLVIHDIYRQAINKGRAAPAVAHLAPPFALPPLPLLGVMVLQVEGSKRWLPQPPGPGHILPLSYHLRETMVLLQRWVGSTQRLSPICILPHPAVVSHTALMPPLGNC